nr:reverse transcriptase domain-containing protein [Tanacetum cinerariifolium]
EPNKVEEGQKKVKESIPEVTKDVLSYVDKEERIVVHGKHPEQIVVIGKHLPTSFKRKLQDLFRSNADVFAWTCADMKRIPRTIMVGGKSFNTDHKVNEYKHIRLVKQKKRGLALERKEAACKEKLILTLVHAARRLRRYFKAYPIRVLTDKPIKEILARPEKSGRIAKCAIEMWEHDIEFKGCNSVKG